MLVGLLYAPKKCLCIQIISVAFTAENEEWRLSSRWYSTDPEINNYGRRKDAQDLIF